MGKKTKFVHLHVHSAYSLAEGAIKVKDLVGLCQKKNMPAVAVTDTNNLFGALEFAMSASGYGIQPILGSQVDIGIEGHQLVLLVQSEKGYKNLCKLVSDAFLSVDPQTQPHATWEILEECSEGIICLGGALKGPVGQYLLHNQDKEAERATKRLKQIFGDRFYMEVQRHGLPEEDRIEDRLIDLAYKHEIPLVATNDAYFAVREMHKAHDALLCIAEGRYVIEEDRRKVTPEHYFKSSMEMEDLFKDLPEAIDNTHVIAKRCHFLLKPIDPLLPPFDCEGDRTEVEELQAQAKEGLEWRLDNFVDSSVDRQQYYDRLKFELDIIIGMGFPGYFLICSDFIKWAKEHDIPVGPGRGSGAGSVVAWALKITDLDPIALGLLFERFLNPERVSMPDFDVDFCQDRRDEVIKYVQDKYGHDKVAQIITFGKLQARAVVRDVGRVLQIPYGQVDRLSKMIPNNPANPVTLQEALDADPDFRLEVKKDETSQRLIEIALQLEGLYRHASTHAAGLVIGDRPLHELVALYRDPRSDMPVTQFNMKYVEQTGLVKFDFLGLKTMTVVQRTVDLLRDEGIEIDVLQIPLDDQKSYDLMTRGDTVGVFQLESAGMQDALRKVKPNRFEDIIALVSLYRPGPMDNIPLYVDVKEGRAEADYMHPLLQPFLEETYGIMIYQEQVQLAARALSGYSLGSADLLRRAMGKKIQSEMDEQRKMFMDGAKEHNDVPPEVSGAIFDQIAKFAGYGFNKSHAAAYALIAYWTAWLKANHPVQFMAASMTLDMQNTDKLSTFKQELDRMGIELRIPNINLSEVSFKVEEKGLRYALAALKGVGAQAMQSLVDEREDKGAYADLEDFINRIDVKAINKKQIEQLACAGAFDEFEQTREQIVGATEVLLRHANTLADEAASGQSNLFGGTDETLNKLPPLPVVEPWDNLERLSREFKTIGFYLSAHPLDSKEEQFERLGIFSVTQVKEKLASSNTAMISMAGVLIKKQIKVSPKSGKKYAFLQLSDATGVYEVTIFSETLARAQEFLNAGETLLLKVIAEEREDQVRYTATEVQLLDGALDNRINEIHIHLTDTQAVQKLKTFLDVEGRGQALVKLIVDTQDSEQAELTLPGRWSLSSQARMQLTKEAGISEIHEI